MINLALAQVVQAQVAKITDPLYNGVADGLAAALDPGPHFKHLLQPEYAAIFAMVARTAMREAWSRSLPGVGWTVAGNPQLMCQILLRSPDDSLTLRPLKQNKRVHVGGVPVAGNNSARRAAWAQQPLLPGQLAGSPLGPAELILLWDYWSSDGGEWGVSTRVVHPIAPGRFGSRVPLDLSAELRPDGELAGGLTFGGAVQEDDLFADIIKEGQEGEESDQGS